MNIFTEYVKFVKELTEPKFTGGGVSTAQWYLGQVATACRMPTANTPSNAAFVTSNNRTRHYNRSGQTLFSLQLRYANWFVNDSLLETASGGALTITASVEYPLGTKTQVTWATSTSQVIADGLNGALSDKIILTTPIPDGAEFFIRTWCSNPNGVLRIQGGSNCCDSANSEVFRYGAAVTDQTMAVGTTITSGTFDSAWNYGPCAIVSNTNAVSIFHTGDSRALGVDDVYTGLSGDKGQIARSIGPYFAYSSFAKSGDSVFNFLTSNAKRLEYIGYFSHVFNQLGYNDIEGGPAQTGAQTLANMISFRALFPTSIRHLQSTAGPGPCSSTDLYASNQTINNLAKEAQKVILNQAIRAGISGVQATFDINIALMTATDSGLWALTGVAGQMTADGIHDKNYANQLIQSSGAVNHRRIVR